jgi:hypothetical protein
MSSTLRASAYELLKANTRHGQLNGRDYLFTIPSAGVYPFQWFWDSCFHAIVWASLDRERAQEELRGLLAVQTKGGLLPHVIFWDERHVSRLAWHYLESRGRADIVRRHRPPHVSAQIQPPIIAQAVEAVAGAEADAFLDEALPGLARYYRFLAKARDPDRDGLISIIAQFESGLDFSPAYDPRSSWARSHPRLIDLTARLPQVLNKVLDYDLNLVFRLNRRQFEDVLVNSIYIDGLQTLGRLARKAGKRDLESWALDQAARSLEALLDRCYDERRGLFFNLAGPDEHRADHVKTIISLTPLLLSDLPATVADRLVEHLSDPREFWTPFPVPSVARDEPSFRADSRLDGRRRIWRGPCSMNTNWLLVSGLRRHGHADLAEVLAEKSRALVEQGGFNEFFNPITGSPVGAERFGWATLAAVL